MEVGQAKQKKNKKGRGTSCRKFVEKVDTSIYVNICVAARTDLAPRHATRTNNIHLPSCSFKPSVASIDRASLLLPITMTAQLLSQ